MDITEASTIPKAIQNALDPTRKVELKRTSDNRLKAITNDISENEKREYFIKLNTNGTPISCTCMGDKYHERCRHRNIIRIINGELDVPSQVTNYQTNGVEYIDAI
jgi:hypothetical protein